MENYYKPDAAVRLLVNSPDHAELLAKALRDSGFYGRPIKHFTLEDAELVLKALHSMPSIRCDRGQFYCSPDPTVVISSDSEKRCACGKVIDD